MRTIIVNTISDERRSQTAAVGRVSNWLRVVAIAVTIVFGAAAQAQQPKKIPRIGYFSAINPTSESSRSEAIRQALREQGYIDGQNIAIEYRYAEGRRNRYAELAAELAHLKVDVILVTGGGNVVHAVKNATKTIPIVMAGAGADPVDAGIIESLARPGGNVTGITNIEGKLGGKRLELLREAVAKVSRVAVLSDPVSPNNVRELKEDLPPAARALKLTLQPWEVARDSNGFERVFAALNKQRTDGLYVLGGPLMRANQKRIVDVAL
jgi:putative ABC transport system substrate-binding protein